MKNEIRPILSLLVIATVGSSLHAAFPGKSLSCDYSVQAEGRPVEVIRVPVPERGIAPEGIQPYSYAVFTVTNRATVVVDSGVFPVKNRRFTLRPRETRVIEGAGRQRALVVAANPPEPPSLRRGAKGVRYFGPGQHFAGLIELKSHETLYLAPGAWVEGFVLGKGDGIRICGGGVLSGACWNWHQGPKGSQSFNESGTLVTLSGHDIRVEDVTLFSSWGWTLVLNNVTNAVIDSAKVICGRVINDDGIDICRAKDVVVRNCFVRCQDDCITPKYWCENLVVTNCTLWTDSANAFRLGYECEKGSTGLEYRNLLFKDIDILHLSLHKPPPSDYWANCAIFIQPANDQLLTDIVFDDLRFHEAGPKDIFLNVKTMPITAGSAFCRCDRAGYLGKLTLRNIQLPDSKGGMCVWLEGHDAAHPVRGIRFENVTGYGTITTNCHASLPGNS